VLGLKRKNLELVDILNFNKLRNKLRRKIPWITEFIYWKWLTGRNNEYSTEKQLLLCVSLFLKSVQLTPTGAYPIWSILETVYDHVVAKSGRPIGIYYHFFLQEQFFRCRTLSLFNFTIAFNATIWIDLLIIDTIVSQLFNLPRLSL
jgi:hypothetical protein